jgi:NAD(P)-dependent dehydrogenase (short-subunit alcohol dehydrogenase family)
MTKSVAVQHAKDKIRANSVHPGIMPSPGRSLFVVRQAYTRTRLFYCVAA